MPINRLLDTMIPVKKTTAQRLLDAKLLGDSYDKVINRWGDAAGVPRRKVKT
jgi:hypothetical protein